MEGKLETGGNLKEYLHSSSHEICSKQESTHCFLWDTPYGPINYQINCFLVWLLSDSNTLFFLMIKQNGI